ncbi:hypothetical protein QE394_000861 [Arthrobacter sp. SORGH_AS 212]|nr:hypothetical protein [Arthrobacter sp. SORGH_AS_0212]
MTLFLKAFNALWCTGSAAATALVMAVFGNTLVPFPLNQDYEAPLSYLLPLMIALLLGYTTYTPDTHHVTTTTRPIGLILMARFMGQLVIVSLPGLLAYALLSGRPDLLVGLRNILMLSGLTLITSRFTSQGWFWLAPVAYMLLVFTLGVDPSNTPTNWALPLHSGESTPAAAISSAILALGLACSAFNRSPLLAWGR